jgi:two-component system chemotaxis response regulator CheY
MKTLLIVDDSSLMRRIMKSIATDNGYKVVGEAANGKIALKKYRELRPDIVTMDLVMDVMCGLDALKLIIEEDPEANVIIVSSMSQDVIVRDALDLGAKSFLLKPYSEEQVINAFNRLEL